MPATKYTKSISGDTATGTVSSDGLVYEIGKNSSITKSLERIDTAGDVCDIWFKDVLSGAEQAALDALVSAHGGEPPPGNPRRKSDGATIVVIEPADVSTTLNARGYMFTATKNSDTNDDNSYAEDREIQGVILEVENFAPGDWVELHIVMPSNPEVVLNKFAETIYVKPSGRTEVVVQTSSLIPAGIVLRLCYHSVGLINDPEVYYDYLTWKK